MLSLAARLAAALAATRARKNNQPRRPRRAEQERHDAEIRDYLREQRP